jgi:hypothetical protein
MANDKIYPIDMNSKDILLQNEGGGGMIMNDQFIGIVGNMLPDQKKLLDDQEYTGGTNIQTDKFSSNIIITNASSNPVGVNDLASKNFDSLDQSIGTNQVVAPAPKEHCGGANLLNYEFQEAAQNFSLWEEINSDGGNSKLNFNDNNNYLKTEDQLNKLLFSKTSIDVIKGVISLDNSSFKDLGWGQYGSGLSDLSQNVLNFYDNYFLSNKKNDLGKIQYTLKYFKNNNGVNKNEARSVFDIQTLPSGLRVMALQNCYNSGDKWINRILTTMGPNRLNVLNGIFGITIEQSKTGGKGALPPDEKAKKFFDQYDDIINTYNEDKPKFLKTLATETKEWYGRLVDQGGDKRYKQQNKAFKDFYNTYVDIALAIALKYADCPDEYELAGNVPTAPTPSPSVTVTAPPTVVEINEDLYESELLPASEDETFKVFDDEEYSSNSIVLDLIAEDPSLTKNFNPRPPTDPSILVDMKEISQWVKMYKDVQSDWDNGWINPNHPKWGTISINPYLLQSIASACKKVGIIATITVAKTNHNIKAKGGADSRHWKGTGVDIGILNGISGRPGSTINNMVPEFRRLGTILYNQLVADGHGGDESLLGTNKQVEASYDKSVLFMTDIGGNHYNHLHVGNRILSAPGVKPKIVRY